jgi:N-methylhydantoinase A
MASWMVGVDTGGTFTDLIAFDAASGERRVAKVASDPADPSQAVIRALDELFAGGIDPADIGFLAHGTTVATNALIEGKGVKTGLLITQGFRAVYEARGWAQPDADDLLDPFYVKPPLLAPQRLTHEIAERLDYRGEVVEPLSEDDVRDAVRRLREDDVEAVAVCFLFSFLNDDHEERAGRILAEANPHWRMSLSSRILPTIREYPRLSTTVIDAHIGPIMESYLTRLAERIGEAGIATPQLFLMQSNGGLMRINLGARFPNQTLLSGPAAGVVSGVELAGLSGRENVVTFDMGGTSTDISVVAQGRIDETSQGRIAGQDIGTPMLAVRTLGAGGGTIAHIGADGLMKVGPTSAGADPGPACYGRGGEEPTVTDANLVLGRLSSGGLIGGRMRLDTEAARAALAPAAGRLGFSVERTALGVIGIVAANMVRAIRAVSVERGHDPRDYALMPFGGAGPLHAAEVARSLGMSEIIVPEAPGILCAEGLIVSDLKEDFTKTVHLPLTAATGAEVSAAIAELTDRAADWFDREQVAPEVRTLAVTLDLRYVGQNYELPVTLQDASSFELDAVRQLFFEAHRRFYGFHDPDDPVELITVRVTARGATGEPEDRRAERASAGATAALEKRPVWFESDAPVETPVYERAAFRPGNTLVGPAIIEQFDSTTVLHPGDGLRVDDARNLIITVTP